MKMPIKGKYFDEIKAGKKTVEYRDAHITFVNEDNGDEMTKDVECAWLCTRYDIPNSANVDMSLFDDEMIMCFRLKDVEKHCFVKDDVMANNHDG